MVSLLVWPAASLGETFGPTHSRSVDLGSMTFCFGGGGTSLVTVGGLVAYSTTIHAEVIGQTTLLLLLGKFTILCKGIRDGGLGKSGGTRGLVRLVIKVLLLLLRFSGGGLQLMVGVLGLLVGFVVIRLIELVRMGFLVESFPMMGVNRVCKVLQFSVSRRFVYLTYDVLDAFCSAKIIQPALAVFDVFGCL